MKRAVAAWSVLAITIPRACSALQRNENKNIFLGPAGQDTTRLPRGVFMLPSTTQRKQNIFLRSRRQRYHALAAWSFMFPSTTARRRDPFL